MCSGLKEHLVRRGNSRIDRCFVLYFEGTDESSKKVVVCCCCCRVQREDLEGNEIRDTLVKAGACKVPEPSTPLTFLDIFSRTKHQNKTAWIVPPQSTIGINVLVLEALWLTVLKEDQTLLADFRSGHLKQ
ncbi:RNase H domain-containing protein [Trichonephila clavipes]|nr:RNase H domain-containing protein [Trichonephila clavipes]